MIKLRLTFGGDSDKSFDIEDGELLSTALGRALDGVPLQGRDAWEVFQAVVNGHHIEGELWGFTKLRKEDTVLVTPALKSGESGQLFKQALLVVITAVAAVYVPPLVGGAGVISGVAVGAITIAASMILSALIPPPNYNSDLSTGGGYESSQMYTISGQSNQVKRFELVPKVYGRHRMFPNVAATPYMEMQADPASGELAQYLHVIYDFGLGPAAISDIKIGDSPLTSENFSDFQYNLVDPNKPDISEGEWDDALVKEFAFYKGDIEGDSFSVALNGNQDAGDDEDTWESVKNSAPNPDGVGQEIILNFTCPRGLYSFSSSGAKGYGRITLEIEFSKVGEDNWHKYSDMTYVSHFDSVGGENGTVELNLPMEVKDSNFIGGSNGEIFYNVVQNGPGGTNIVYTEPTDALHGPPWAAKRDYRVQDNDFLVIVPADTEVTIGSPIFINGYHYGGVVINTYPYSDPTYTVVVASAYSGNFPAFTFVGEADAGGNFVTGTAQVVGTIKTTGNSVGRGRIQRSETAAVNSTFKFTPREPAQYKVRVRRLTTASQYSSQTANELTWVSITTRFDKSPINTTKRHVFMELKIRATSQLNGTVSNLSAVVSSALQVYDSNTETWSRQLTSNPAWVFTDLMTGEVNKKALPLSRLHMPSLVEWAEYCDEVPTPPPSQTFLEPRFATNFVLDFSTQLQGILNQVAGAAQASLNIIDGKYGVLIDKYRTTPVQIFTPRNSKDFTSSRIYGPRPDGLKVKYVDPFANWEVREIVAYDNGFNEANAETIEDMTSFACTNNEQAWRFGRYMIAQNRLRQETISITVDFEYLVCTRGDYVQVTQDVMRVGGTPCRVKAVAVDVITTDDSIETGMGSYGYTFRNPSGVIYTSTLTPLTPNTFQVDGTVPAVGDLIVIGEVGSITFDCLVKAISPNDDLSATLTLIEKADGIYDYESTDVLPDYDPQISGTLDPDRQPPGEVRNLAVADTGYDCNTTGTGYDYFVDLSWDMPASGVCELFEIYVDYGSGYDRVDTTRTTVYKYSVKTTKLGLLHRFKVLAVSATGRKLPLGSVGSVSSTPEAKSTPPSDVAKLSSDITNEVLQLSWDRVSDCDVSDYLIRFSPNTSAIWENTIPILRIDAKTGTATTQARTGIYLIKAVDFNGTESANAASAITTIPNLFNLNVVDSISDSPTWDGTFDRVVNATGALLLDKAIPGGVGVGEYYSDGYYYYQSLLDLGDIYTVRLQSSVQAEGFSEADLMSSWTTLASVLLLSSTGVSAWGVETQYRSTDQLNVISTWTTLSSITAINEGLSSLFTPWRTFLIGDATARVFQFRLRLISNVVDVTPRVFDGTISADMPDRVESFENLTSTASGGYVVSYSTPFYGPGTSPNVQISIDGASSGDYWAFDYKNLTGFSIRFYNSSNVQVARQFDVAVKGYGRKNLSVI